MKTQTHFNDMCVRTRQLGLTYVVAALGLAVVTIIQFPEAFITLILVEVHMASFIVFAAAFGILGVRILDLSFYHRMLRGSVQFGLRLEKTGFAKQVSDVPSGMTEHIHVYSRHDEVGIGEDGSFSTENEKPAAHKIRLFYNFMMGSVVAIGILIMLVVRPEYY